jgi:hypothetical protein
MAERKDTDGTIHETTTEARAGVTPHVTRYVLTVGLGLVVVIFALLFFFGSR